MDDQIIKDITAEIDNAFTPEGAAEIGMLTIKTANQTVEDAAMRPDPDQLYHELWYEGEVCCLFADSNLGKSIYAVQIADEISQTSNVLYVDCELSDKQFQLRYTNSETGERHIFPDGLLRAEVNPYAIGAQGYEEAIIRDIETAAERTGTKVIIIDNLTYLCNSADKGVDAGIFMMKLMALEKKRDLSLLIIAHTPKRDLSSPITQNHLAGSKKLYNFFDSVFAIGMSAKDNRLRYVKQVKVRAGAFTYDAFNIIVYEVEKVNGFLRFNFREFATEEEHLRHRESAEISEQEMQVIELSKQGLSCRKIAEQVRISKSTVNNILNRHKEELSTVQPDMGENGQLDSGQQDNSNCHFEIGQGGHFKSDAGGHFASETPAYGNGSEWTQPHGWSIYTSKGKTAADVLATCIFEAAKKYLPDMQMRTDNSDGDQDFEEAFYILSHSLCPAVLSESGFMTNEQECRWLQTRAAKQAIVDLHVEGIIEYLSQ